MLFNNITKSGLSVKSLWLWTDIWSPSDAGNWWNGKFPICFYSLFCSSDKYFLCFVIFHRRLEISLFILLMNNVEFTVIFFFSLRMNHKAVQNFYKASQLITMHASVHLLRKTDSFTSVTMSAIRFSFIKAKSNVITTAYQNKKGIHHKKLMKTQS